MQRNNTLVQSKYMEYLGSTLAYSLSIYLATIVDGLLVGQLMGPTPLTAINLTMPIVHIKNIVFMLFINGGTTLASQFLGQRRKADVDKLYTLSILGCMAGYSFLLLMGCILCAPLSRALSLNGAGQRYVQAYLIPLLAAGPVQAATNGNAAFLRLDGRHKLAMAIPIVSNLINLSCDYIFIRFFGWGIAGAGWATVTGYVCGLFLLLPYLKDSSRNLHLVRVKAADLALLPEAFRVGLPMALIQGCNVLKNYTMNSVILSTYGDMGSVVISVCNNALFYAMMFADGASTAMSSVCAALFGEKDLQGVFGVLKRALWVAGGFCLAIFLLLELFPVQFGLFYKVTDPQAQQMLGRFLRLFVLYLPVLSPLYVFRSFYQATKQTGAATAISILEGAVVTVPVFLLLVLLNPDWMWLSNCLGALLSLGLVLGFMYKMALSQGGDYHGWKVLLLQKEPDSLSHEFSLSPTEEKAQEASQETITFLRAQGLTGNEVSALGIAAEELCVNISRYARVPSSQQIDAFLWVLEDKVLLKIRDCGVPFNPTRFVGETGEYTTGLSLIQALGCKIEYDRILGFNTTMITAALTREDKASLEGTGQRAGNTEM